ncbi:MAG TPA: tetratricopeptide repeat protein, partial [Gemmatimonadales bacterium]|nr:tetratricopeptide repeat protein [Gemmatimonadales bacterium]
NPQPGTGMATSEIAKLESRWRENPQGLTFAPLAEAYRKLKDPARALEILRPGLERHPDYIPANIVLGRCHWDLNDLPAAERAFTHVLSLDGENVIALKALADITERLTRYDEAERWLESLLVVDRSNDEARAQLERVRTLYAERGTSAPDASAAATTLAGGADAQPQGHDVLGLEPTALAVSDALAVEPAAVSDAPASDAADDLAMVEPMELEPTAFEPTAFEAADFAEPAPAAESATPTDSAASAEEPVGFESFGSVSFAEVSGAGVESMSEEFIPQDEFAPPRRDAAESTDAASELESSAAADEPAVSAPVFPEDTAPASEAEAQPSAPAAEDDFGVERTEEIVLHASGGEFQTPSAAEDLMQTAGPQGDALQPEPHVADSASTANDADDGRWSHDDGSIEFAGAYAGFDAETAPDVDLERPLDADAFVAPVAEFTPEPAMEPAPESEPETHLAHPTPAVPRGQTGSDHPAEPEPDLVVTETMAEVYLRQGHVIEALAVYRELSRRSPNDLGLRNRIAELELRAAVARGGRRAYAASETGGQSVAAFLRSILAARPAAVGGPRWAQSASASDETSTSAGAGAGAGASNEAPVDAGAPTRPAGDPLSLGSVFGEEPPAATPAMPEAKPAAGVSYDEFFGAPRPPSSGSARPNSAPGGKGDDDLDQFHSWLQGLKR